MSMSHLDRPHRRLDLERELEAKGISGPDAAQARAFARFLELAGEAPEPRPPARVGEVIRIDGDRRARAAALEVYGDEYARGLELPMPQRWEGDDG